MDAISDQIILFSLIFMRMTGFVFLNPVLGRKNIPAVVKSALIMVLTIFVFPMTKEVVTVSSMVEYVVLLLKEFGIGYLLGFVMEIFFFTLSYAGAIIDFQMGLSMATVYDPQNGSQIALTGNVLNIYAMLLFFATDGHLALIKILVKSADIIPFGQIRLSPDAPQVVLQIFQDSIVLALKIAFPMLAIILVVEAATGILMKVVPQINIFVLSIQIKITLGLSLMIFLISPMGDVIQTMLTDMLKTVLEVLKMIQG